MKMQTSPWAMFPDGEDKQAIRVEEMLQPELLVMLIHTLLITDLAETSDDPWKCITPAAANDISLFYYGEVIYN